MDRIRYYARHLRNNGTDAERHLWKHLRAANLGGVKFRRQYPLEGFILDFACVPLRLAIELDGGQHVDAARYDAWRTAAIETGGWRVLRFWNDDVLLRTDVVLEVIFRAVGEKPTPPQPSPASKGGRKNQPRSRVNDVNRPTPSPPASIKQIACCVCPCSNEIPRFLRSLPPLLVGED